MAMGMDIRHDRSDDALLGDMGAASHASAKIAVLGGDLRQMVTAAELAKEGYEVAVYAADAYTGDWGTVTRAADLTSAVRGAELVILPLPVTQDGERLHCPLTRKTVLLRDVFSALSPGQRTAGGKITEDVRLLAKQAGVPLSDYLEREELAIANAVPTAEGAIAVAMAEVPYTIHGAHCLVLGYGRVGKVLARTLLALGAHVTVAARKSADLAWIAAAGCTALPFASLRDGKTPLDYDILFNTVPQQILDAGLLGRMKKDTLLLDLASAPGGVDRAYARENGLHAVWALSLPGKTAPVTAGRILHDSILEMLEENRREDRKAPQSETEGDDVP